MKTIAIDARTIKRGSGRYVYELVKNLEVIDSKHKYKILVLPDEADYFKPASPNFEVVVVNYKHYSYAEQLGFNNFLRKLKPDLVHFWMPQQPLMYTRPAVTTVHDLNLLRITQNDDMGRFELRFKQMVFAGLLRRVAHRTKHIITPSNFTKNDLVSWAKIKPSKVTVVYEGVLDAKTKPKPIEKYKDVPYIMYLGRAEPYKNNRGLIYAHQRLLKDHPYLRLVIVGAIDVFREADKAWVKDKGFKNVDFTGFLPDSQIAWLYKNCEAYVQPALMEGFGLPGLEAMSYGAPVAAGSTTSMPEIYGKGAIYFDPRCVDDMTEAIDRILNDPKLGERLRKNGAEQVKKFSWEKMARQILAIYNKVLGETK